MRMRIYLLIAVMITLTTVAALIGGCTQKDHAALMDEDDFAVVIYDSCEYVFRNVYETGYMAHKGNCRFCAERHEKEMKKLMKDLTKQFNQD